MPAVILTFMGLRAQVHGQDVEFGLGYSGGIALGAMSNSMDAQHGFHVEGLLNPTNNPWSYGLGFSQSWYDNFREDVEFTFSSGAVIEAPMVVNHRISSFSALLRYDFIEDGPVLPYATVCLHWVLGRSVLAVRDPDSRNTGEGPINLYEETMHADNSFGASLALGSRFDIGLIFPRLGKSQFYFRAEVLCLLGPEFEFAFSERLRSGRGQPEADPATSDFEIIEGDLHNLRLYREPLSLLFFKAGVSWRIPLGRDQMFRD